MASCEIANTAVDPKSSTVTVYVHDDGFGTELWEPRGNEIHLDFCLIEVPRAAWDEYCTALEIERKLRHAILVAAGHAFPEDI